MQYETTIDFKMVNGTSLRGYITATYDELVAAFGQPSNGDNYKVQAEWAILLTDEDEKQYVATIYDWKCGDCYNGPGNGIPAEAITSWNVGGHTSYVLELLERVLFDTREMLANEEENRMYQWDFEWEQGERSSLN